MSVILKKAWRTYIFFCDELADPRTKEWPLVAKPYQGILLLGLYLMFVLKWGPKWMENRKPFNMKTPIMIYNLIQVATCTYMFILGYHYWGWRGVYRWVCEPVDYSYDPDALFVTKLTYTYFLLKIADLLDTVFFVLRKKNRQISFLHIYHHTGMVVLIWAAVTYYPGGHGTLVGQINNFVHAVMYFYYFLSVAIPSIKQTLWLKKMVTQLQIVQFLGMVIHMSTLIFKTDCDYPRWTAAVFLPQNFFMLVMFTDFYIKTYIKKPKQRILTNHTTKINENYTSTQILNNNDKYKEVNNINKNSDKYFINKDNVTEINHNDYSNRDHRKGSKISDYVYENIEHKNSKPYNKNKGM